MVMASADGVVKRSYALIVRHAGVFHLKDRDVNVEILDRIKFKDTFGIRFEKAFIFTSRRATGQLYSETRDSAIFLSG